MLTKQQLLEQLAKGNQEELFRGILARVRHEHYWRDRFAVEEAMAIAGYPPFRCEICAPSRLQVSTVLSALWPILAKTRFDCVVTAALGEFPLFPGDVFRFHHLDLAILPVEAQAVLTAKSGQFDDFRALSVRGSGAKLQTDSTVGPLLRALACYGYVVLRPEGYALSYGWNGRFEPFVLITPEDAYGLLRYANGSDEMRHVYDAISYQVKRA